MNALFQRLILALFSALCATFLCACASHPQLKAPKMSIEKKKDPLFGTSLWWGRFVKITSNDESTDILLMRVNEGHCPFLIYKLDEDKHKAYVQKFHLKKGFVYDKDGKAVSAKERIFSNERAYFGTLSDEAKALYAPTFPIRLHFSAKERLDSEVFKCDLKEDIEKIELALRCGKNGDMVCFFSYEFDEGGKGKLLEDKEDESVIEAVGKAVRNYVLPLASLASFI